MKLTIRQKLLLGLGSSLLFTILSAWLMFISLDRVKMTFEEYADLNARKLSLAQEIQYKDLSRSFSVRGLLLSPNNLTEQKRYAQDLEEIIQLATEIEPLLSTAPEKEIFEDLNQKADSLDSLETQIIDLSSTDLSLATVMYEGEYTLTHKLFADKLQEFKEIQYRQNAQALAETQKLIQTRSYFALGFAIFALVAGSIMIARIARSIIRPLMNVVTKMRELSGNAGDLTVRFENTGRDELGQLASAFNSMLDTMQSLIRKTVLTTEQVAAASEQLSASAAETSEASEHIAVTIQDVAEGSYKQVQSIEQSSQLIEELSAGAQQIASYATDVSHSATHASQLATEGNTAIQTAITQMSSINSTMHVLADEVEKLGGNSQRIGEIVTVISDIAEQTNLLALNAAIEAARAGEHGRGFAVVAGEVRKLAEGTTRSAKQISELATEIQSNSKQTIRTMETSSAEVAAGITQVDQAGASFQEINHAVQAVSLQIQKVSAAVQQMYAGTEQAVQSIDAIANITNETSIAAHNVSAGAEEQLASMEEIRASAEHLAQTSEELQVLIGKFHV
ncbi:methyl-accepting chemotaxis protein [Tumebacillus algifaecis]|nr:HAMP domain-containing methyl-accepting chemotaxis protein [Tumebacillus algifaecis]